MLLIKSGKPKTAKSRHLNHKTLQCTGNCVPLWDYLDYLVLANLQGEIERLKAAHAVAKERQKWKNGVDYIPSQYPPLIASAKAKIASLRAERKHAK